MHTIYVLPAHYTATLVNKKEVNKKKKKRGKEGGKSGKRKHHRAILHGPLSKSHAGEHILFDQYGSSITRPSPFRHRKHLHSLQLCTLCLV